METTVLYSKRIPNQGGLGIKQEADGRRRQKGGGRKEGRTRPQSSIQNEYPTKEGLKITLATYPTPAQMRGMSRPGFFIKGVMTCIGRIYVCDQHLEGSQDPDQRIRAR